MNIEISKFCNKLLIIAKIISRNLLRAEYCLETQHNKSCFTDSMGVGLRGFNEWEKTKKVR